MIRNNLLNRNACKSDICGHLPDKIQDSGEEKNIWGEEKNLNMSNDKGSSNRHMHPAYGLRISIHLL